MVQFNPDGSIKLPEQFARNKQDNIEKLKSRRCIKITRQVVSFTAPKKCILHITLSEAIKDNRFIETIYTYFREKATVPNKIEKLNDKEFKVEVGTDFRRCSDCNSLINQYREFLDGNIIEDKGSCQYEGRLRNFSYEDYFD